MQQVAGSTVLSINEEIKMRSIKIYKSLNITVYNAS